MLYVTDAVTLADVRVGNDGYLEGWARTARTGCQTYLGSEIGRPDLRTVTIYRDDAAVFDRKSLESFAQIPVTVDHPPVAVTPKNWREHARGTTGTDVLRDGEFLKIGLKITDAAAIADVQSGKRQLSAGYTTDLIWGDGIAPDGTAYQARQTNIVANHIAIVSAGRAGAQCRIGDSWPAIDNPAPPPQAQRKPAHMTERTIMIGDHSVTVSDAAAIAVAGLQKENGTLIADNLKLTADLNTAQTAHSTAILAKDNEIAGVKQERDREFAVRDAEIERLKKLIPDAAALDALASAKAEVIGKASKILSDARKDVKLDGMTIPAIQRAVVSAVIGDAAAKDRSDDYVAARFDILSDGIGGPASDPLRPIIAGGLRTADGATAINDAHAAMVDRLRNGWMNTTQQGAH